jgi:hypothetical protein
MLPVGPPPGARGGLEVRNGSRLFIGRCVEITAATGFLA